MIKSLTYSVTFSNERTIARSLTPETNGTTLIVGRNEAGKSLNLEMFAYALFGSDALRGAASEYKRIKVDAEFMVKGVAYKVTRSKSDATLVVGDDVTAKGTSPVNQRIKEILGFGLGVFKVSNWCAQGDIQVLANMKPTERKQMIDEVSGLTQLDGVFEWVKLKSKELKSMADGVGDNLYCPDKPEKPVGSLNREALAEAYADLDKHIEARRVAELKLGSRPQKPLEPTQLREQPMPVKPLAVELPKAPTPIEPFTDTSWDEVAINNCSAFISAMPDWLRKDQVYTERVKDLTARAGQRNLLGYHRDDLQAMVAKHDTNVLISQKLALMAKGEVECPNCKHSHYIATDLLEEYSELPNELYDIAMTKAQIKTELESLDLLDQKDELIQEAQAHRNDPPMPLEDYQSYLGFIQGLEAHTKAERAYEISVTQHNDMVGRVNAQYEQSLKNWEQAVIEAKNANEREVEAYQLRVNVYNEAVKAYEDAETQYQANLAAFEKLPSNSVYNDIRKQLDSTQNLWTSYDTLMGKYQEDLERYNKGMARYKALLAEREQYELATKALKEVKSRVKGYLVPSLSKVASHLLNQMTGGERSVVEISEDFEIVVDGQSLRTLSGSGKDITNLAIRIALGQVLTHKVFPLMMFDEIDAAMDDTRAQYTWDCIQKITPLIGQVLLVSHKDLNSTHRISV